MSLKGQAVSLRRLLEQIIVKPVFKDVNNACIFVSNKLDDLVKRVELFYEN